MSNVTNENEPNAVEMVDALNRTFGSHGVRASHPKGVSAHGVFEPSVEAAQFSSCPIFAPGRYSAAVRFSIAGGNPRVSDKAPSARGMSLKIQGPGLERLTLVMISAPVFFAANRASFVAFLDARQPDPITGKPDPARIEESNRTHTDSEAQRRWLATTPPSASYATAPYFAVHSYLFDQADGSQRPARWLFEPVAGRVGLSADELKSLPDDFLVDELSTRLRYGPAQWRVRAIIPEPVDPLHNPTAHWPETREMVELGLLSVTAIVAAEAAAHCEAMVYDPEELPTGIKPAGDPIFSSRSSAYSVSAQRRGI